MANRILIAQTGDPVASVAERRGPFSTLIRETIGDAWTGEYETVDIRLTIPVSLEGVSAIVITGSSANVPDRLPWMLTAEAWLRDVVARRVPTFGICFGHQILAQALGGEVVKNPRGREIGTRSIARIGARLGTGTAARPSAPTPDADPIFEGLPDTFRANVTHVDTVARLPTGAASLARSDKDDHQAIRFTDACYGVQFHPEIDGDVMRSYIETRREILFSEGLDADGLHREAVDAPAGAATLKNFVRFFVR